jgi:selenocysteine-specific elongation factor
MVMFRMTDTDGKESTGFDTANMKPSNDRLLSVNIGVLGHVDSGKTSLCKALSTTASTAAFDSNPQSQERGITLDLGFSCFSLNDMFCITLVDCPGHASLIRTVLGGTQIMDFMILVLDSTKGMQAQSWECLILASIVCPQIIVVLNKVDLIEESVREKKVRTLFYYEKFSSQL